MNRDDLTQRAQEALKQWSTSESQRRERLAARGALPELGDVYALPCHSGITPSWVVVERADGDTARLVPGDDRPWANLGDLWVDDESLCLRLAHGVTVPAGLLRPDQRIDLQPDAPRAVVEHEAALRFGRIDPLEEDEEQLAWRRALARTARMLPRFLQDGVVELRLSEFVCEDGSPAADVFDGEHAGGGAAAQTKMAADSSSLEGAFLRAVEDSQEAIVLHELDVECGGTLTLLASRKGLGLHFEPDHPGATPPVMQLCGEAIDADRWVPAGASQEGPLRQFMQRDWHQGPLTLQLQLQQALTVEIANDLWTR